MSDLIDRQAAIDGADKIIERDTSDNNDVVKAMIAWKEWIKGLPPAQPTLYGYNIEHLAFVANMLEKENIPPERLTEVLNNIGRIVAMVRDEFEKTLRTVVEQGLPSAQSQYTELTPEEAASEIASGSIMSASYWLDLMIRLKQMGYAICRKR